MGLPRGIPAASLKRYGVDVGQRNETESSAGNTRGLIEAEDTWILWLATEQVFRGEYPRPH